MNFAGIFLHHFGIAFSEKPRLELPEVPPIPELQGNGYVVLQPYSRYAKNPDPELVANLVSMTREILGLPIICVGDTKTPRDFEDVDYSHLMDSPLQMLRIIAYAKLVLTPRSASAHIAAAYSVPSIVWVPSDGLDWHLNYPYWKKVLHRFETEEDLSIPRSLLLGQKEKTVFGGFSGITRIISVRKSKTDNLGDRVCSPFDYFKPPVKVIDVDIDDIDTVRPTQQDLVVLGGGGVFFPKWKERLKALFYRSPHFSIWGAGLNTHDAFVDSYPDWVSECKSIGVRDRIFGMNWVPCPSCMHPAFDKKYEIQHEKVVYQHKDRPIPLDLPKMTNNAKSMDEVISFLGSGKTVVTNSYHGMYWASLLGRKVELWKPFSSRFVYYTYRPLNECRYINSQFGKKLLSLETPLPLQTPITSKV